MNLRCQTLKRKDRIRQAGRWIAQYTGKNIIKGYGKHFKVDLLCAARELQMLGLEIPEFRIQQLKKNAENRRKQHERRRQLREQQKLQVIDPYPCSNEYFYYIAGYTSGGAPFGITWEEMGLELFADAPDCQ